MLFNIQKYIIKVCITNVIKNVFIIIYKTFFIFIFFSYFYLIGLKCLKIGINKNNKVIINKKFYFLK